MKRLLILSVLALAASATMVAQNLWGSATVKVAPIKPLTLNAEFSWRSLDKVSGTERLSLDLGAAWRFNHWLRADAGYMAIYTHQPLYYTNKGNIVPAYWYWRHRAYASVNARLTTGRFTFSLRELYQLTCRPERFLDKFGPDGVTPKRQEVLEARNKSQLRSRLQVEYNIRHCPVTPYASVEIFNHLNDRFRLETTRVTVGADWSVNKKNEIGLYYRFVDHTDADEPSNHIIGVSYTFALKLWKK